MGFFWHYNPQTPWCSNAPEHIYYSTSTVSAVVSLPILPWPPQPNVAQLRRNQIQSGQLVNSNIPTYSFHTSILLPPPPPLSPPSLPHHLVALISCFGCPHWFSCRPIDYTTASYISVLQWEASISSLTVCTEMWSVSLQSGFYPCALILLPSTHHPWLCQQGLHLN